MDDQTTTISSQTVERLHEISVRNYFPQELSLSSGGYRISLSSPAEYGLDISTSHLAEDSSRLTMFASERVLARDWNSAEEDEAWAHL